MFGMGGGEMIVVGLVALFVLGPERLPGAIRTVAAGLSQAKSWMDSAKQQLDAPELQQLREPLEELRGPLSDLRAMDPRRAARDLLVPAATKRTDGPGAGRGTDDDAVA